MFQLTRPRGTRQLCFLGAVQHKVSTHASAGDATPTMGARFGSRDVSTHASAGDATSRHCRKSFLCCFNSRVRGGRDVHRKRSLYLSLVSTHASAGDATGAVRERNADMYVSTHASAGDATDKATDNFLPILVSTHASAGDATCLWLHLVNLPSFNSRVRGGRDQQRP